MRILVLLAIALLLYIIISNLLRKNSNTINRADKTEKMVKCELCGLHVVERESFHEGGHYFCCNDHLEAARRRK